MMLVLIGWCRISPQRVIFRSKHIHPPVNVFTVFPVISYEYTHWTRYQTETPGLNEEVVRRRELGRMFHRTLQRLLPMQAFAGGSALYVEDTTVGWLFLPHRLDYRGFASVVVAACPYHRYGRLTDEERWYARMRACVHGRGHDGTLSAQARSGLFSLEGAMSRWAEFTQVSICQRRMLRLVHLLREHRIKRTVFMSLKIGLRTARLTRDEATEIGHSISRDARFRRKQLRLAQLELEVGTEGIND